MFMIVTKNRGSDDFRHAMRTRYFLLGVALAAVVPWCIGCGAQPVQQPPPAEPASVPSSPEAVRELGLQFEQTEKQRDEGRYDQAIESLTKIVSRIREKGDQLSAPELYEARARFDLGHVYLTMGDGQKAAESLRTAVELCPEDVNFLLLYGLSQLCAGSFEEAASTFRNTLELSKDEDISGSACAGLYVAEMRAGKNGRPELAKFAEKADVAVWPTPVIRMLLGEISPEECEEAAKSSDEAAAVEQKSLALAFSGESFLIAGDVEKAKVCFDECVNTCPVSSVGHILSRAELVRLGVSVPPVQSNPPAEPAAAPTEPAAAPAEPAAAPAEPVATPAEPVATPAEPAATPAEPAAAAGHTGGG